MKRFFGPVILICVAAIGAYLVYANRQQPQTIDPEPGVVPQQSPRPEPKPRVVSQESIEYLQKLRKRTPFGTESFDLAALRAGMGSRREPKNKDIKQ